MVDRRDRKFVGTVYLPQTEAAYYKIWWDEGRDLREYLKLNSLHSPLPYFFSSSKDEVLLRFMTFSALKNGDLENFGARGAHNFIIYFTTAETIFS